MNRFHTPTTFAALALLLSASAFAADKCKVPKNEWQTQATLEAQLKAEGWTVKKIKVDAGCFEVYGLDKSGHKQEVYFNPKTLKPVQ